MEFLYFLEGIRNPVCDFLFSLITLIGSETFFLAIAIFVFWCVDKRCGYYVLVTGLFGTVVNQFVKITAKIPRPWHIDESFTVVGNAAEDAGGYSFPSGHTQNVVGTLGSIASYYPKKKVIIPLVSLMVLVAFSRMYLGVHTPYDVLFSLFFAALLVIVLRPLFTNGERFDKVMPVILVACALVSLAFLIYVFVMPESGVDAENLNNARENACTLFACMLGFLGVYFIERKFIRFDTSAKWYSQIFKLAIGLIVIIVIKSLLKSPLNALFGGNEYIGRVVRYLLIVVFAGLIWPLSFKFWSALRINSLDRLTDTIKEKLSKKRHAPEETKENVNE